MKIHVNCYVVTQALEFLCRAPGTSSEATDIGSKFRAYMIETKEGIKAGRLTIDRRTDKGESGLQCGQEGIIEESERARFWPSCDDFLSYPHLSSSQKGGPV